MPTDTWTVRLAASSEQPFGLYDGIIAILNRETRVNRLLDIRQIWIEPIIATNVAAVPELLTTLRISAASGGTSKNFVKLDTANASLPSQVVAQINPTSITSSSTLHRTANAPNKITANLQLPQKNFGTARLSSARLLSLTNDDSIQSIILREGEGIALTQDSFSVPHKFFIRILVTNLSSGETYITETLEATPELTGNALLSLVNGSGSGVVLAVKFLTNTELGNDDPPDFRIAYIDGIDGGTVLTPIAHDTAVQQLENIQCYGPNFYSILAGTKTGVYQDWQTTHGAFVPVAIQHQYGTISDHYNPIRVADANAAAFDIRSQMALIYRATKGQPGLLVKPGQGIAVLSGTVGVIDESLEKTLRVQVIFTHTVDLSRSKKVYVKPPTKRSVFS